MAAVAVIQAIIDARDLASAKVNAFANNLNKQAVGGVQNLNNKLGQLAQTSSTTFNKMAQHQQNQSTLMAKLNMQYQNQVQIHKQLAEHTDRQGMSMGRLISMMVRFGIILQALRLATAPLQLIGIGARDLMETDKGVREINAMLVTHGEKVADVENRYLGLVRASQQLQMTFGVTAKDATRGLYEVASVIQTLNIKGYVDSTKSMADQQAEAITKMTNQAAVLARGGFMPLEQASSALMTTLQAMQMPATATTDVMDIMFQTVKLGKGHMDEMTASMGSFLAILGELSPDSMKMQNLGETMAIFGMLTTVVSAPQAGTAVKRMLESITDRSPAQRGLVQQIQRATGVDLSAANFAAVGPATYFGGPGAGGLIGAVGRDSKFVRDLIEKRTGKPATEAQMRAVSLGILERFTGDKRSAKALYEQDTTAMTAAYAMMDPNTRQGAAKLANDEALKSYQNKWDVFQQNISVVAQTLQESTLPKIMNFFQGVSNVLSTTMESQDYQMLDAGGKIGMLLNNISKAFESWYTTGGKEQIHSFGSEVGGNLAAFIVGALGIKMPGEIESNRQYFADAGGTMVAAFVGGFFDRLSSAISGRGMQTFTDLLNNPFARGAGTFFGLMAIGVPWPLAIMLSAGAGMTAMKNSQTGEPLLSGWTQGIFTVIAALMALVATLNLVGKTITMVKAFGQGGVFWTGNAGKNISAGYNNTIGRTQPLRNAVNTGWSVPYTPGQAITQYRNAQGQFVPPPVPGQPYRVNGQFAPMPIATTTVIPPVSPSLRSRIGRIGVSPAAQMGMSIAGGIGGGILGEQIGQSFGGDDTTNALLGAGGSIGMMMAMSSGGLAVPFVLAGSAALLAAGNVKLLADNWGSLSRAMKNDKDAIPGWLQAIYNVGTQIGTNAGPGKDVGIGGLPNILDLFSGRSGNAGNGAGPPPPNITIKIDNVNASDPTHVKSLTDSISSELASVLMTSGLHRNKASTP